MKSSHFEPLCTIQLRHDYFADGRCRHITLTPVASCRTMMTRYGLRWLAANDGGALLQSVEDGTDGVSRFATFFDETEPFVFSATLGDEMFARYTAGAYAWENDPTGHDAGVVSFSNAEETNATALSDDAGTVLLHLPDQAMARRAAARPSDDPAHASSAAPFAVIALHAGGPSMPNVPARHALLDASRRVTPRTFAIQFRARRSRWRYHLSAAGSTPVASQDLRISVEGEVTAEFTTRAAPADDGRNPVVYESSSELPLLEHPKRTLRVILTDRVGRRTMLPYPVPESTRLEPSGNGGRPHFVSEVFVHV